MCQDLDCFGMSRHTPDALDGLINLNKPVGISSAKALYRVRRITKVRKSGHSGALDPAASGVLVLCLGRATKLTEQIMNQPKLYRASARLDVTSETFDAEKPLVPVPIRSIPDEHAVRAAAATLEGHILQTPPAYSAVKVGGRPAYKLAARNQPVQLKPRRVVVYWIHVHAFEWPRLEFEICCGRGTYVRAIIRDWGQRLGVGGCLTTLTRTAVGPFTIGQSIGLTELADRDPAEYILPLERARKLLASGTAPPARPGS